MATRKDSLNWLKQVSSETTNLFDKLSKTSESATSRSSEVLFGVLGGAIGLVGAYGLSIGIPAVTFLVSGPLAAVFGIPAAILIARGSSYRRIERAITQNRLASDEILERIKRLPKGTPDSIRNALWVAYADLSAGLPQQIQIPQVELPQLPPPTVALALPAPITSALPLPDTKEPASARSEN